jgi:toxin ParE1/3/4
VPLINKTHYWGYISRDKPTALGVVQRVMDAIESIAAFPSMGRVGLVPHTKELVVSGTPFDYCVSDKTR